MNFEKDDLVAILNVNVDNEFVFCGQTFKIDKNHKDYKVFNSYHDSVDYTNTCDMTTVKAVFVKDKSEIVFLDERNKKISDIVKE